MAVQVVRETPTTSYIGPRHEYLKAPETFRLKTLDFRDGLGIMAGFN
jgi:hypothetical protein